MPVIKSAITADRDLEIAESQTDFHGDSFCPRLLGDCRIYFTAALATYLKKQHR
jgi:hypothetical protein